MEPENRTQGGRATAPRHVAFQRVRKTSRTFVRWDGFECPLLNPSSQTQPASVNHSNWIFALSLLPMSGPDGTKLSRLECIAVVSAATIHREVTKHATVALQLFALSGFESVEHLGAVGVARVVDFA
jgi:hypothetical protein